MPSLQQNTREHLPHIVTLPIRQHSLGTHKTNSYQIYPNPVTDSEKALGIIHIRKTPEMIIRNWLTYRMREQIMNQERIVYHSPTNASIDRLKTEFNQTVAYDIKTRV